MIDRAGHIIHIDYGFMFQNNPGNVNFEAAPFKLTQEYVDLMDGLDSDKFEFFKSLIVRGFIEIRKNLDELLSIITIMSKDSNMPCFLRHDTLAKEITDRLTAKNLEKTKRNEYYELAERLTTQSLNSFYTTKYDQFQRLTNGINI